MKLRKKINKQSKISALKSFKRNNIPNGKILLILVSLLCLFGLYMIYSASYVGIKTYNEETTAPWYFLFLQIRGFLIAIIPMYFFYLIPRMNKNFQILIVNLFFIISIGLLLATYIFGKEVNGSTRWLQLPFITIQPSELLKISLILILALKLTKIKNKIFSNFVTSMIIPGIIAIENLSSGLLILLAIFIIFSIYILKKNQIFIFFSIICIFSTIFLFLENYRLKRITNYFKILIDPMKANYQTKESLYALANGGLLGRGITYSTQKFFYLPEHHTDFIFSIIGEELGFLGEIIVIFLFFVMIYLIFQIAAHSDTIFKRYSCLGFGILFALQIFLNLGVVSGLLPVTGVTLPFLSYGGSSIMSSLMMIGFILGCSEIRKVKNINVKKRI